jgi:hypothetical protein
MRETCFLLLDTILFAIPESIFITIITFILMKRYDLIDIYKIKSSLVNVLIPSVLSTTCMMTLSLLNLDFIKKIIGLIIFYLLLLVIIKKNTYTKIRRCELKTFISFLFSFFIAMVVESVCMLLFVGLLNIDSFNLMNNNDNYIIKIMTALSWISIEILIIIVLMIKRNNKIMTIFHTILKNNELSKISLVVIMSTMLVMFLFIYLTLFNNLLTNISTIWQIGITISIVFILPLSVILFISKTVILFINTEIKMRQLYQEIDN